MKIKKQTVASYIITTLRKLKRVYYLTERNIFSTIKKLLTNKNNSNYSKKLTFMLREIDFTIVF